VSRWELHVASFPGFRPESQDDLRLSLDDSMERTLFPEFFGNLATNARTRREVFESKMGNPLSNAHAAAHAGSDLHERPTRHSETTFTFRDNVDAIQPDQLAFRLI
jgi:hypothetical protein